MAAKTKPRPKNEVPCKFGRISIGKETVGVPVSIERSALGLESADSLFTGMRSNATLKCDPNATEDAEGQSKFGDQEIELDAIVECSGFGVRGDHYSATLNLSKADANLPELSKFAARTGTVQLTKPQKVEKKARKTAEESDPAE